MSLLHPRPPSADSALPRDVADALDASADDLRHGRIENAVAVLERAQAKLDTYKAGKARRRECQGTC